MQQDTTQAILKVNNANEMATKSPVLAFCIAPKVVAYSGDKLRLSNIMLPYFVSSSCFA
jgi:hypothetical protein